MCIKSNWNTKELKERLKKPDLERLMRMSMSRIPLNEQDKSKLCESLGEHTFTAHYVCNRKEKLCNKDSSIYLNYGNQRFCNVNLLLAYYNQKLYRERENEN